MKNALRWILIAAAAVVLIIGGLLFFNRNSGLDNYPYEPDTPAPDPHNGVFVCEGGTMTFNGDGESIVIDFSEELAGVCNLPAGEHEGSYVFLTGNLPPHGSMPIRYDVAHELEITVTDDGKESRAVMDLGIASADGSSGQSGVDTVTPERIPFMFRTDQGFITFAFEKK